MRCAGPRAHVCGPTTKDAAKRLKGMRWPLLRRGSRVLGKARKKLNALLASKLATARAWELKETFAHFWKYKSEIWAGAFLDYWCFRAMRQRQIKARHPCAAPREPRLKPNNSSRPTPSRICGTIASAMEAAGGGGFLSPRFSPFVPPGKNRRSDELVPIVPPQNSCVGCRLRPPVPDEGRESE